MYGKAQLLRATIRTATRPTIELSRGLVLDDPLIKLAVLLDGAGVEAGLRDAVKEFDEVGELDEFVALGAVEVDEVDIVLDKVRDGEEEELDV